MTLLLPRHVLLLLIAAAHAALLLLISQPRPALQPPQPLPLTMITLATPATEVQPQPAPAAAPRQQRTPPAQRPVTAPAAPRPLSSKTSPVAAAAVATTSNAQPAEAEPASNATAPRAETPVSAPLIPPTHIGGYLNNPRPAYPPLSIELGEAGVVMLQVSVSVDGRASDVQLARSSGFPRLDRAALQAVRNWRFRPAMRGNEPVAHTYDFSLKFDLSKA